VNAKIYGPIVGDIFKQHGYSGDVSKEIGFTAPRTLNIPVDYIYSNALLPKPSDWMANEHVTGFLDLPPETYTPPAELQAFLDNDILPLVYVGLGSMLGVLYDTPEAQIKQLDVFAQGYNLISKPCRMILHCTTGGGKFVHPSIVTSKNVYLLDHSVPHTWLFPFVDLVAHHGGAGSTQTSLFFGKPTLVLAGTNNADQPFWGDLITRRQLGPKSKLLAKLTPEKFAYKVEDGLFGNAALYRANCVQLSKEMQAENGRQGFVDLCLQTILF